MILASVEAGAGPAPSLVLLHGLFGQARNFTTVQRRLADRRHVVALDLRNHGASPHAGGMAYATLADDVAETLGKLGLRRSDVLGHSMGGKTAMALALTRPELVRRLVVVDVAPVAYAHGNAALVAALQALPLDAPMSRSQADRALVAAIPNAVIRSFLLQNFAPGERPGWRCGLALIAAALPHLEGWDVTDTRRFAAETLLIRGGASDYVGQAGAASFRTAFPKGRIETVADAAHWVHADAPERFVSLVEDFLDELLAGSIVRSIDREE